MTTPDVAFDHMLIAGLAADAVFELNFTGPNADKSSTAAPGVPVRTTRERSNENGILWIGEPQPRNARLRLTRV